MQLLGTLIGTGVGFTLALYAEHIGERRREERDRSKTIRSILGELDRTESILDIFSVEITPSEEVEGAYAIDISTAYFSGFAFDTAVHSGRLALLEPDLQVELSTCYEAIRLTRRHYDRVATFYDAGSELPQQLGALETANKYLQYNLEILRTLVPDARKSLLEAGGDKLLKERQKSLANGRSHESSLLSG